ncbi:hypothetical protein KSF73_12270 [Burkholderiaceae bacterium DAT-1]|nr:hypothetical protein [Burkholderiaceae bacterium DAT-1]
MHANNLDVSAAIHAIETARESKVLVLAASHLEMDLLPTLYDVLNSIGRTKRLDVILQSRGGEVNAARRIALLLREYCKHLSVLVPWRCESAATILSLAANEILAGPLAIFSPIDPHLHGGEDGQQALSSEDIRLFARMSEHWFGQDSVTAHAQAWSTLCNQIFPTSLTAFYRVTEEVLSISTELLQFPLAHLDKQQRRAIAQALAQSWHSHAYALTLDEMANMGLSIRHLGDLEQDTWQISRALQRMVGGACRASETDSWIDTALITRTHMHTRVRTPDDMRPSWQTEAVQ